MRNRKGRIAAAFLAALMVLMAFTACNPSANESRVVDELTVSVVDRTDGAKTISPSGEVNITHYKITVKNAAEDIEQTSEWLQKGESYTVSNVPAGLWTATVDAYVKNGTAGTDADYIYIATATSAETRITADGDNEIQVVLNDILDTASGNITVTLDMPAELDDENDQFWYTYEIAGTGSRDGVSYSMSTRTQGTVGASGQATITINADDLLGTGSDLLQGSYVLTVTIYDSADAGTTNVTRTGVEVMRLLSGLAASGTINLDTQVVNEEGFLVLVDDSIGDKIVIAADDFVDNTANEIDGSKPFNFDITFSEASGLAGADVTIRGFLDGEELNASTSPYTFTTSTTDPAMSEGADIRTIFSGLPGGQHVLTYVISENGTQIGVGSLTILAKVKADITITPTP